MMENARLAAMGGNTLDNADVVRSEVLEADPWEALARELGP
jgi:hypothetical protein